MAARKWRSLAKLLYLFNEIERMNKQQKKLIAIKYGKLLSFIYRILHPNKYIISGNNNTISLNNIYAGNNTIRITGNNNKLIIEPGATRINNCKISIWGSNSIIRIGAFCNINHTHFYIEDDGGIIEIGQHTTVTGKTQLSVIEGQKIRIGERCLFSDEIDIRVGDSHSIIDNLTNKRLNPSKEVLIEDHVWIGHKVSILKGARIKKDSIIATGAIITNKEYPSNVIIGGIGGSILRNNITWDPERIPVE